MYLIKVTGLAHSGKQSVRQEVIEGITYITPLLWWMVDIQFDPEECKRWDSVSNTKEGRTKQKLFRKEVGYRVIEVGRGLLSFNVSRNPSLMTAQEAGKHGLEIAKQAFKKSGL